MIKKLVATELEKTHIQYKIPKGDNKFAHSVIAYYDASNAYASYVVMQYKPKFFELSANKSIDCKIL